jgi:hypothetical protein
MGPSDFSYRATKDGRVRIAWRGRIVTTLAGGHAAAFLGRVRSAPEARVQHEMARATGNFRHGNERR